MKYLLVLVVVVVGLWILSARFRRKSDQNDRTDPAAGATPASAARPGADRPPAKPQEMVACGHCGMHLPAQEAVYRGEVPFCGVAHLEAGPR